MSFKETLKNHKVQLALVSVVGLAAGSFGGYTVAVKRLETKYEDISQQEIAEAKEFYSRLNEARNKPATPSEAVSQLIPESELLEDAVEAIQQYAPEPMERDFAQTTLTEVREEVLVKSNLFKTIEENNGFDMELELAKRDTSKPYLINEEEWQAAEPGYDQITLTYYEGDNVLAAEDDSVIDNLDQVVGEENLSRFGDGTGDENTMFIRNEKFKSDYEVVRSDGKYVDEVLGLSHGDDFRPHSGVRKFRNQDE
jgi:hypothetical protein